MNAERLAQNLLKSVAKAHRTYRLFEEGDRIAVAVSGGKDSAVLLDLLLRWDGMPRFSLAAVHVTARHPQGCGEGVAPAALAGWFEELGIRYSIVPLEAPNGEPARGEQGPCFHCAWRRRKALFLTAHELGCNKVALAHHADDVAVTTLLNLIFQGRCETMPPRVEMFGDQLTIIRPLYLVEERDIVDYVRLRGFPLSRVSCERGGDRRRSRMKDILRRIEAENPRAKRSLLRAVQGAAGSRRESMG